MRRGNNPTPGLRQKTGHEILATMPAISCLDSLLSADEVAAQLDPPVTSVYVRRIAKEIGVGRQISGTWVFTPGCQAAMQARPDQRPRQAKDGAE